MKDRIYKIMTERGMNQKEFAEATGISTATLSNIFNGKTSANLNHAQAIHQRFPEINFEWLVLGKGDMHEERKDVPRTVIAPTLFDTIGVTQSPTAKAEATVPEEQTIAMEDVLQTVKEVVQHIEKPQRNVVEIRVFFDDGTYDVFSTNHK